MRANLFDPNRVRRRKKYKGKAKTTPKEQDAETQPSGEEGAAKETQSDGAPPEADGEEVREPIVCLFVCLFVYRH